MKYDMPPACHRIRADQILTAASGRCPDHSVIYLRSYKNMTCSCTKNRYAVSLAGNSNISCNIMYSIKLCYSLRPYSSCRSAVLFKMYFNSWFSGCSAIARSAASLSAWRNFDSWSLCHSRWAVCTLYIHNLWWLKKKQKGKIKRN